MATLGFLRRSGAVGGCVPGIVPVIVETGDPLANWVECRAETHYETGTRIYVTFAQNPYLLV